MPVRGGGGAHAGAVSLWRMMMVTRTAEVSPEVRWSRFCSIMNQNSSNRTNDQQQQQPGLRQCMEPQGQRCLGCLESRSRISYYHNFTNVWSLTYSHEPGNRSSSRWLLATSAPPFASLCWFSWIWTLGSDWHWRAICHQTSHSLRNFPNHCNVWIFVLWKIIVCCLCFPSDTGVFK